MANGHQWHPGLADVFKKQFLRLLKKSDDKDVQIVSELYKRYSNFGKEGVELLIELQKEIVEALLCKPEIPTRILLNILYGEKPILKAYEHLGFMSDSLCFMLRQKIWGKKVEEVNIQYPRDWWQAVKERFAPKWLKRRWPIEYSLTKIDITAFYPKLAFSALDSPGVIIPRILDRGYADIEERFEG